MELLKLINFDCKNERFAEVFGDCIESEDIGRILKEARELFEASDLRAIKSADTADDAFDFIDCLTMEKIGKQSPRAKFGDRKYFLIRAFFRFVNDSYNWEDLEDLRRWEGELFDSLPNEEQKNFCPVSERFEGEALRSLIFFEFCHYLGGQAFDCVEIVSDDLTDCDRLGYYLGGF